MKGATTPTMETGLRAMDAGVAVPLLALHAAADVAGQILGGLEAFVRCGGSLFRFR